MYQMISGTYSLEGRSYTSFGIQCGNVIMEDISLNKAAMLAFVSLCNRELVEPVHLPDIVTDFLAAPDSLVR